MATSQIASMLDELMGRNRNAEGPAKELEWTDDSVCRFFLVDFCPHDLFTNTKADLGPCGKIHDEELKSRFAVAVGSRRHEQYVDEFVRFAQRMLTELATRIKKAKERLYLTQNEDALPPSAQGQHKDVEEKMKLLTMRMTALVEEAEKAGCEGNVEQAQGLLKLSEQLRDERDQLRRSILPYFKEVGGSGNGIGDHHHQKAMEVCDTCGAFLIVGDAQQRIDDHLGGKQHIGYAKLRDAVAKILDEKREKRQTAPSSSSSYRPRSRSRSPRSRRSPKRDDRKRSKHHYRDRSRDRDRERDRRRHHHRHHHYDRDRDRPRSDKTRSRD